MIGTRAEEEVTVPSQESRFVRVTFGAFVLAALVAGGLMLVVVWGDEPGALLLRTLGTCFAVMVVTGALLSGHRAAFPPRGE